PSGVGEPGRTADADDARRIRPLSQRRCRQVGAHREGLRSEGRPVTSPQREGITLQLLSGGAAQGIVGAIEEDFRLATGAQLRGTFGAVGAMRDKLLGGAPCDAIILTAPLIAALEGTGHVRPGTAVPLGRVRTGIAVRAGEPLPAMVDGAALRATLLAAAGLYFPDPELATAGIHFVNVLRE